MKALSSKKTFFFKKIFPVLWFGFLCFFLAMIVYKIEKLDLALIVIPLIMMVFGFFLFRYLVWGLADEVIDCGEYLIVKRNNIEERIKLEEILNVSMSQFTNPPRVSLRLRKPGKFGDEVLFMPIQKFQLNPFARNEVVEDLMKRTDSARSGR